MRTSTPKRFSADRRNLLVRQHAAVRQARAPPHKRSGVDVERQFPLLVRLSDQLDGGGQALTMVKVAMREDQRLNFVEAKAYEGSVAPHGMPLRARIKKDRMPIGVGLHRHHERQPVMRRAKVLAGQALHAGFAEHSKLRGNRGDCA